MKESKKRVQKLEFLYNEMPKGFLDLVPAGTVEQYYFPIKSTHNAIWDYADGANGKHYVALCNEFSASNSAILFEFDPSTQKFRQLFDCGKVTMCPPNAIPPSKIHTSIHPMRDGRIIMSTHTTSPAPGHKSWLMEQYYYDNNDGYPGSHILIYDPVTGYVEAFGCPFQRESIYGMVYCPRRHALFFNSFLHGELYKLELETRKLTKLGKTAEWACWRLTIDRKGNIYTTSRSGHLWKVRFEDEKLIDLGVMPAVNETNFGIDFQNQLQRFIEGPDGLYYMAWGFSDLIYSIDIDTDEIKLIGNYLPEANQSLNFSLCSLFHFDSKGALWYGLMQPFGSIGTPFQLYYWDFLKGGKPRSMGMLGTPERVLLSSSEQILDFSTDTLYVADTNHGADSPAIAKVNLREILAREKEKRPVLKDVMPVWFLKDREKYFPELFKGEQFERCKAYEDFMTDQGNFLGKMAQTSVEALDSTGIRIWERVPLHEGHVHFVRFKGENLINVWCGDEEKALHYLEADLDSFAVTHLPFRAVPDVEIRSCENLPFRMGRKFLAVASASCELGSGTLFGTEDGMVALKELESEKVVSYGALSVHSPVHQLVKSPVSEQVYGVAGSGNDLGLIFAFDRETGLRELGRPHIVVM
ncbi:MAG: hypothetical protein IPN67_19840 [Bacteroidales bacterium]|nr:hypothetical protein [Bacteroidales bacterium]